MPEQPAIAQPPKSKSIAMPKAVGIRFSKRKANQLDPASIEVDEDAVKPVTDSTAAHNNITAENSLKAAEDASDIISSKPKRQKTASPLSKSKINDSGLMTTSTAANGQITPPVNESENINNSHLSTSNIHFLQDSNMDDISGAVDPSASIEHDDDASQQPIEGVITRNAAKTKSASPNFEALQQTVDTDSIMQDDDESVANEVADEDESTPATPTGRGRGRWPNGAVKARNAAAAAALSKKNGIKKKGAPGKRKISDNALVQAIYDRQARLRTQYKEVRKALIKSELEHLDRSLEELEESEDRYKQCPAYEQVIAVLDKRLADEIATRERQEQIERDMLDRRREADAALAWREFEVSESNVGACDFD